MDKASQMKMIKLRMTKRSSQLLTIQQIKSLNDLMNPFMEREMERLQKHSEKIIKIQSFIKMKIINK